MRDDRTLMDVLKNDDIYRRLTDWERTIIRRSQYELDTAQELQRQAEERVAELEEQLRFVVGHELGHARAAAMWNQCADYEINEALKAPEPEPAGQISRSITLLVPLHRRGESFSNGE